MDPTTPRYPVAPTGNPAYALTYAYSGGQRVLKTSKNAANEEVLTLEVFGSRRVERTTYTDGDFVRTADNESLYLGSLGRVMYGSTSLPGASEGRTRLLLQIGDGLGSTSVTLDHRTSEVVEKTTYDANGNTESDYRPSRWSAFREDYRFTGKEEDIEVGLTYFGARYLNTNLRRWISPDPLTIHGMGGDSNPYAYVGGRTLSAVDPWGLEIKDVRQEATGGLSWVDTDKGTAFEYGPGRESVAPPPPPPPQVEDVSILASLFPVTMSGAMRPLATGAGGPAHWAGVQQLAAGSGREVVNGAAHAALATSAAGGSAPAITAGAPIVAGVAEGGGVVALNMSIWLGARVPQLVTASTAITSVAAGANGNPQMAGEASTIARTATIGEDVRAARIVRKISHGERVGNILSEVEARTRGGLEHGVVSLADGRRVIVSGGADGIDVGALEVRRMLLRSHIPGSPPGASPEDFLLIDYYFQRSSWLMEVGDVGARASRFRTGK